MIFRALTPCISAALMLSGCATNDALFPPAIESDFADPFVLVAEDTLYAYSTNTGGVNLPMARASSLTEWQILRNADGTVRDAMPTLAPWVVKHFTWAPEVIALGDEYLLYYTAREGASGRQCIGLAVANDPMGPFVDTSDAPLLCQRDLGGTIDANPFRDTDGQLYLYFKNDGNAVGAETEIWVQKLSDDGRMVLGEASALATNDQPWEEHVIEAPTMARLDGQHVLFFSANHFGWEDHQRLSPYAMGYALCDGPLGPCRDAPSNPILSSINEGDRCLSGPGHQSLFRWQGEVYLSFHAWGAQLDCRDRGKGRFLHFGRMVSDDGRYRIEPLFVRPAASSR